MFHFGKLAIILLLCTYCCLYTRAQPYYFRHYQVENGLSNSTVFCSVQDKDGFLWFGTKEGLNRFDGYHFKLFTYQENIAPARGNDMIYCLFSDSQGTLWVGGQKGLFRFDRRREQLIRVIDSLIEINYISGDDDGNLWFLSRNNVYRYNISSGRLKHFPDTRYFFATSICKAEDGSMWFTAGDGYIEQYHAQTQTFTRYDVFSHSPIPSSRWLQRICSAGKGRFLIGTSSQGLKLFDAQTGQYKDILTYNPDKTTVFVRDIIQYGPDEFWLGTESGIFILHLDKSLLTNLRKKALDPYSLSDNAVYSLCKDTEGGVWVGTYFGGLNHYSRQYSSFQKYYPDNSATSISGSAVREICQDPNDNIWIGTEDAGLNKLDIHTGDITHYMPATAPGHIAYSNIHGLLSVGNELWIGTFEHGLDIMDIRTGKVIRHYMAGPKPNELKSNFVLSLIRTGEGQIVLGASNGAYWYNANTDDFTPLPGIPSGVFVAIVAEDHEGTLWIGTHGSGVYFLNPHTGRNGHFDENADPGNGLSSPMINAIMEDSEHTIWFSTEGGGLCTLASDRHTWKTYTTADGLPSNFIFRCVQDNKGNHWVTTSRGLVNIQKGRPPTVYTRANGLLNDQFNYNSGFKDKDGKLYFGSVKGMITFFPDDFEHTGFSPAVYITGFQVGNIEQNSSTDSTVLKQSILYTDKITLPYDQSTFSIDFAALSYAAPERTAYRFIMQGLDKVWTDLNTNRKIYFTNLAPGKYTFKLKAAVDGHWSDHTKELSIEIRPPFWATIWAYILYMLLIILLAGYIISNYHRRTQIKKEKEIYEAKIEFFTNVAHEIRTPLTLIKGPAENLREMTEAIPEIEADVTMMERNTDRLIALVTQILDFRRTETRGFSLDFTSVNITQLLREIYLNFRSLAQKKGLNYQFEHPIQDLYVMADEEALNKIFSNLFGNAVKYGQHQVLIRLLPRQEEDADLVIEIANDGNPIPEELREKIFEPFYRLKDSHREKGTGIGLALARSLTTLHSGRVYLDPIRSDMNVFIVTLPSKPVMNNKTPHKKKIFT